MSLSNSGFAANKDTKLNSKNKVTSLNPNAVEFVLNPNAAEFIPSAFRAPLGNTKTADLTKSDISGPSAKSFDRSESNISNKSEDEVQKYWRDQLPDDITPDFTNMGEEEPQTHGGLSLANLSLYDDFENPGFYGEKMGYLGSNFLGDQPRGASMELASSEWDKRFVNGGQQHVNERNRHHYDDGGSSAGLFNDSFSEQNILGDAAISAVEYLASQFPGFAVDSLADIYYANGCDLNLTIEILTQLELQVDANFSQNTNTKSLEAPSFNPLDFPALTASENPSGISKFNGEDTQLTSNIYKFPSNMSKGVIDFASTVRKLASQESAHGSVGSSRSSQLLNNSYNANSKLTYGDKLRSSATSRAAPVWLETGDAVASMYSDLREEARDFARLRNACFEQARQAYLIGNGSLARELSRKGQLYNMQMKAAHGKAKETIYRQRNPGALDGRAQDRLIDLHGLHVSEAIQVLQRELSILRGTARSAGHRLQVMICVGTGHHTKGTRTPARLPIAVEQFLVEEGLSFTQPQPGLLRVVIY